jgi:uncharacterized MnhB-related membrane protein
MQQLYNSIINTQALSIIVIMHAALMDADDVE